MDARHSLWQVAGNRLQAHAASRFLAIKYMAVLILLCDPLLAHLIALLPLHLIPVLLDLSQLLLLAPLDLLGEPRLIELIIEHVLIGVLQFILVDALLLNMLGSLHPARLVPRALLLLDPVLFFLFTGREICHVLLVDVRLLVERCALVRQVPLLVRVERIILQLGTRGQVSARLARLKPAH